ncbi:MAG: alpha/beta fold hydrolase [Solirubrobacterales bacterium]|nr:alpha/beta fold hydrolase [Solirubrobacterales bacterium]
MAPESPTLLERQFLRARNGFAYMTGANRPAMGRTPRDLIWRRDKARLWRYRSDQRRYRPPVLIVHSLVSKSYILDLLPGTSMIRFLIGEGIDVFLLDWEPADPADAENTLETYVDGYIPDAIGVVLEEADAEELTVIGYCFGGVLTLLLAAADPGLPIRNMMVMATPCDYREMGFMSNMFRDGRLGPDDVIDETGLVPASALDEGFQSMKPTEYVTQRVNFFQNLWNDEFVEGFLAIAIWARDQVPFPGGVFRQTVDRLIRQNALYEGVIPYGRREIRLKDITCPFLNAYAEQDTITPARSSEPLAGLVGSKDVGELRLESGHIGFVAGRQAAKVARPQMLAWLADHSDGD